MKGIIRIGLFLSFLNIVFLGCDSSESIKKSNSQANKTPENKSGFFELTEFFYGNIIDVSSKNLLVTRKKTKDDDVQVENIKNDTSSLRASLIDFFDPVIDSNNVVNAYNETRFIDETINAVTISCELKLPLNKYPYWLSWNIYIDPETGKIKKVYLIKQISKEQTQQLTWNSNHGCQIRNFFADSSGNKKLMYETEYIW